MSGPRLCVGRFCAYLDPRDMWVGAFFSTSAIYVCPVPFVVLRWARYSS